MMRIAGLVLLLGLSACSSAAWEVIGDIVLGPSDPCAPRQVTIDPGRPLEGTVLDISELRRACVLHQGGFQGS